MTVDRFAHSTVNPYEPHSPRDAHERTPPMKILLVDDSKTMRNIQKRTLATLPEAQFVEAGDGVEGLAAMTGAGPNGFQLVLVDWNMPNMDGLTFVQRVRETD